MLRNTLFTPLKKYARNHPCKSAVYEKLLIFLEKSWKKIWWLIENPLLLHPLSRTKRLNQC